MRLPWFAGLGVGVAFLLFTQSALWGLAAGLVTFALVRWLQPQPPTLPLSTDMLKRPQAERATSIEVVCKTATPARQEWVSVKTGRLYDVLSANGLEGARPGDRGRVTLIGTAWRIDPPLKR